MSEEKKEDVKVRDLKPNKDAKGGRGRRQGAGQGGQGPGGFDTAGRGKHYQQ